MIDHDRECPARHRFLGFGNQCDCGADDINRIVAEVTEGFRRDLNEILGAKEVAHVGG